MTTKKELSEIRRKAAQMNTKHYMQAFERNGEDALDQDKRAYLRELQKRVSTQPGRVEIRQELTASLVMICDLGFSYLRDIAENKGNIWESGVINRLATYINSLRLLLDNWPNEQDDHDTIDLLAKYQEGANDTSDH